MNGFSFESLVKVKLVDGGTDRQLKLRCFINFCFLR